MSAHTPFPWVDGGPFGLNKTEVQGSARAVASVWTRRAATLLDEKKTEVYVDDPEGLANLRLILALPSLIDALLYVEKGVGTSRSAKERIDAALREAGLR